MNNKIRRGKLPSNDTKLSVPKTGHRPKPPKASFLTVPNIVSAGFEPLVPFWTVSELTEEANPTNLSPDAPSWGDHRPERKGSSSSPGPSGDHALPRTMPTLPRLHHKNTPLIYNIPPPQTSTTLKIIDLAAWKTLHERFAQMKAELFNQEDPDEGLFNTTTGTLDDSEKELKAAAASESKSKNITGNVEAARKRRQSADNLEKTLFSMLVANARPPAEPPGWSGVSLPLPTATRVRILVLSALNYLATRESLELVDSSSELKASDPGQSSPSNSREKRFGRQQSGRAASGIRRQQGSSAAHVADLPFPLQSLRIISSSSSDERANHLDGSQSHHGPGWTPAPLQTPSPPVPISPVLQHPMSATRTTLPDSPPLEGAPPLGRDSGMTWRNKPILFDVNFRRPDGSSSVRVPPAMKIQNGGLQKVSSSKIGDRSFDLLNKGIPDRQNSHWRARSTLRARGESRQSTNSNKSAEDLTVTPQVDGAAYCPRHLLRHEECPPTCAYAYSDGRDDSHVPEPRPSLLRESLELNQALLDAGEPVRVKSEDGRCDMASLLPLFLRLSGYISKQSRSNGDQTTSLSARTSPSCEWYALLSGIVTRVVLEGYLLDGWTGEVPMRVVFGIGVGFKEPRRVHFSSTSLTPSSQSSHSELAEDSDDVENTSGGRPRGEVFEDMSSFEPDGFPSLEASAAELFPFSSTFYHSPSMAPFTEDYKSMGDDSPRSRELAWEEDMRQLLEEFRHIPYGTSDLQSHFVELSRKYPAEPIEHALTSFLQAISDTQVPPDLISASTKSQGIHQSPISGPTRSTENTKSSHAKLDFYFPPFAPDSALATPSTSPNMSFKRARPDSGEEDSDYGRQKAKKHQRLSRPALPIRRGSESSSAERIPTRPLMPPRTSTAPVGGPWR